MKLKPYPEYKDSEVPHLGKIPTHWKVRKLKYLCQINPTQEESYKLDDLVTVSFLPMERARANDYKANPIDTSYELVRKGFTSFQDGDVLLAKITPCFENGKGAVCQNLTNNIGFGSTEFHVLRPTQEVLAEFIYYLTNSSTFRDLGVASMQGSAGQQRVPTKFVANFLSPLPSIEEQREISDYIKFMSHKINRFIRNKRSFIKLINEQKQVIISQAVTRGLNPETSLKPSGIPYLGDVPIGWKTTRLKYLFAEVDDRSTTGTETLFSLRMHRGLVPHVEVSNNPIDSAKLIGFKRVKPPEIVMNRMRASIGMFGVTHSPGIVSPDYAIFKQIADLDPGYYLHLFKVPLMSARFRIESRGLGTGSSGFLRLYSESFGAIFVPQPPVDEQTEIVDYINKATASLNALIDRAQTEIELIQEYRNRLIADVVTGKIDVRDIEIPALPDEDVVEDLEDEELLEEAEAELEEDGNTDE